MHKFLWCCDRVNWNEKGVYHLDKVINIQKHEVDEYPLESTQVGINYGEVITKLLVKLDQRFTSHIANKLWWDLVLNVGNYLLGG